ncbi:hypothetical protein NDN08_006833 [Rhodosorus marinus]|uniref:Actin-related protein 8 n=1 Tax=Rhodosorus marinus TaxID=101924 RepID=A0AAV8ULJ4_9RHOD|nr:hypothetical protein NDN08_006833 [Rhodosorus marinus]
MEDTKVATPLEGNGVSKVEGEKLDSGIKGENLLQNGSGSAGSGVDPMDTSAVGTTTVIQLGSYVTRYGGPNFVTPKSMRTAVAFSRLANAPDKADDKTSEDDDMWSEETFDGTLDSIVTNARMLSRRRGGGRPVPWAYRVEQLDTKAAEGEKVDAMTVVEDGAKVLVGNEAITVQNDKRYDVIEPIKAGRLNWEYRSKGAVRESLHILVKTVVQGSDSVILILPEQATRSDVAEVVDLTFQVNGIQRVFVHHSSVAAAFGAGLSSCVVVDIGHSSGYVVCMEDGTAVADSRVKIPYGGREVSAAIQVIADQYCERDICEGIDDSDEEAVLVAVKEQLCDASGEDNDSLAITNVALKDNRNLRVSVGVGLRSVAVSGLFYPKLLQVLSGAPQKVAPAADDDDSKWFDSLVDDTARAARAAAARPLGFFSTSSNPLPALDEAVEISLSRVVEGKPAEKKSELKRFLGAVLLVGGSCKILNLGRVLEQRLRAIVESKWPDIDSKVVEVVVGEKDMDPSELAWKGGAVMAHTESSVDFYVHIDEWKAHSVRTLREKAPFFW